MMKLIPKCQKNSGNALGNQGKILKVQNRALQGKEHNQKESSIASEYFKSPSIVNLAKGVWHWINSKPGLLGEREDNLITGIAPSIGPRTGINTAQYIRRMTQPGLFGEIYVGTSKGLKAAKAADTAIRKAKKAKQVTRPVRYVKEVYNIKTGLPYDGALPKDWETMLPRENWAIRTILK